MKPKKSLVIILALIVIVLVALLSAGAVYFFLSKNSDKTTVKTATVTVTASAKLYDYAIADPFVTNVKDSRKLFKTTIVLVADKEGMDEILKENQYTVRDTILFDLRNLTEKDIENEHIEDTLRQSIPKELNKALGINNIVSLYFSDFVMQ